MSYLIQEFELTKSRIRTAFTITLIISWTLFFFLFSVAEFVSDFYEDQRVETYIF